MYIDPIVSQLPFRVISLFLVVIFGDSWGEEVRFQGTRELALLKTEVIGSYFI